MSSSLKLSDIGTTVRVGAAACAMAGAAVLAPGVVANASPIASVPTAGLGASADSLCDEADADCVSPFASPSASASTNATLPLIQNDFIWFGPIPDDTPDNVLVGEFNLINLLPDPWKSDFETWWASFIPDGVNACVLGATVKVDSYSTLSVGFTNGCDG